MLTIYDQPSVFIPPKVTDKMLAENQGVFNIQCRECKQKFKGQKIGRYLNKIQKCNNKKMK